MARSGKRNTHPSVRPVIRAELSEKNRTLRWILIIGFACIALISLVVGLRAALVTEPGWEMVESASTESNVSGDFVFSYCYGQTEEDPSTEKKRLTMFYSELTESAYSIFCEGLAPINENVNQPVTVDPALYKALEVVQKYGNRNFYLAPIYAEYRPIFLSATEEEAAEYSPYRNRELKEYVEALVPYCSDPAMIDLQLLGNDQVCLRVSDEYAAYAAAYEITEFVAFDWMTNAFVADFLAEGLADAGFTNGYLSSFDGFTRNLDDRGELFSLNLFDRQVGSIYMPAAMHYEKPISIVFLRDFPMSEKDSFHYYAFDNNGVPDIVSPYVNPLNGMDECAVSSLTGYAYDMGCAEVLMQLAPVFINMDLDDNALNQLRTVGIYSVWFDGKVIYCNDPDLPITIVEDGLDYTVQYIE